jgi:adenylate kinase family enzyme
LLNLYLQRSSLIIILQGLMKELNYIVLTGRFAAGKDTQADLLRNRIGKESVSIVDTGKIYIGAKSNTGEFACYHHHVAPYIEDIDVRCKLLPDSVMTTIVQEEILKRIDSGKETFIFTGFPRTIGQLDYFNGMFAELGKTFNVKGVFIEYKISDEITLERSRKRRVETLTTGGVLRPWEATDDGIMKRIDTYYRDIEPMLKRLKEEGKLFTIEANQTIPEIEAETLSIISKERN